ncbi:tRNA 5-methoxyuridine(34)/uridine 5-oxyacetic acid(34) synthase CmoB [Natronobiforma cellulositropha]|uniref:tRNA 5-methoxyuridine(34)/uridine 5-oxyacetic acid(34) synthase CmoB n=1 Tax=Natronobiforma cellulositropha TaxID=1679076 RepID=UPI0021D5F814|nr:tRNA 5-methoxyuridine(34)/uridine 5-oxyacetic acid(34) synthase CmoB [Natronobiforma cellulositropha]
MDDCDPATAIESHYDALTDRWHEFVDAPARAHVLWSTVVDLLPDLEGARVLDAGCGNGNYLFQMMFGAPCKIQGKQ